jgi:hypothetical protein
MGLEWLMLRVGIENYNFTEAASVWIIFQYTFPILQKTHNP